MEVFQTHAKLCELTTVLKVFCNLLDVCTQRRPYVWHKYSDKMNAFRELKKITKVISKQSHMYFYFKYNENLLDECNEQIKQNSTFCLELLRKQSCLDCYKAVYGYKIGYAKNNTLVNSQQV